MVSGSISLPSRGSFHLSLTVLFSIGHWVVFSLRGWSPYIHTGFLVSHATLSKSESVRFRLQDFHFLRLVFPYHSTILLLPWLNLGSFHFARRYFENRIFSFFSSGYLDVSVHQLFPLVAMYLQQDTWGLLKWVSPFGYSRINGYLLLPETFRSLSRPSSALSAKAFTLCPWSLDQKYISL